MENEDRVMAITVFGVIFSCIGISSCVLAGIFCKVCCFVSRSSDKNSASAVNSNNSSGTNKNSCPLQRIAINTDESGTSTVLFNHWNENVADARREAAPDVLEKAVPGLEDAQKYTITQLPKTPEAVGFFNDIDNSLQFVLSNSNLICNKASKVCNPKIASLETAVQIETEESQSQIQTTTV